MVFMHWHFPVPKKLFEHEANRDPVSVNEMKQACVIVIHAYFT